MLLFIYEFLFNFGWNSSERKKQWIREIMSCRVKNSATQTRVLCHVNVKNFTKISQKNLHWWTFDVKIENSEAKISHSLFNKSASTSNKERGWRENSSFASWFFFSFFRGKNENWYLIMHVCDGRWKLRKSFLMSASQLSFLLSQLNVVYGGFNKKKVGGNFSRQGSFFR